MSDETIGDMWNRHAGGYDRAYHRHDFYHRLIARIVELASPGPGDVALDIGTGTGALALALAPKVAKVIAIDVAPEMVKTARAKAAEAGITNVDVRLGNFLEPGLNEQVDVIVSSLAFEWVPDADKRRAIDQMRALLRGRSRIVLGDRMLMVDPTAGADQVTQAIQAMAEFFGTAPTEADVARRLNQLAAGVDPATLARLGAQIASEHREIQWRPDNLQRLFESRGFVVERVEAVSPMIGILCASVLPD
jgi:ubiquinone/menaquinone biosynthesis C-methylase UbiE